MDKRDIYWKLEWFDAANSALVGEARLDTLTDDEVYDTFDQDRDDPCAFDGLFEVNAVQAAVLQRHTDHRIDLDRYTYTLGEVDATPSDSSRSTRDDALSMTTVFQGKDHKLSWYLAWSDSCGDEPASGERTHTLTTDEAFEILRQDRYDPHAFRGGCKVGPEHAARLQAHVKHRIDLDRYEYHLHLALDPWRED